MKAKAPVPNILLSAACVCLLLTAVSGFSITSGADFLKIPKSPKVTALGEVSAGAFDDLLGIEYNPAGIRSVSNLSFSFMGQKWIVDSYGAFIAGAGNLGLITAAGSIYYLDYGGFTRYDDLGGMVNQGSPHDLYARLAAAIDGSLLFNLLDGFTFGASAAFIERNMIDGSLFGGIVDLGIIYRFSVEQPDFVKQNNFTRFPISLGLSIQNLGYSSDNLTPVKATLGMKFGVITNLNVYMDLSTEFERPVVFKMGGEYVFFNILAIRAGFNLGKDSGYLALGAGLDIPLDGFHIRADYAFSPIDSLGNNHSLSLSIDIPPLTFKTNPEPAQEPPTVKRVKSVDEILELVRELYRDGRKDGAIQILIEAETDYPSSRKIKEALIILTSENMDILTNKTVTNLQ